MNVIVLMLLQVMTGTLTAQVNTPRCTSVDYLSLSPGNVAALEADAAAYLAYRGWTNDVIKTDDATYEYNCHAYAWYLNAGGSTKYWVNAFLTADLNAFSPHEYNPYPPVSPPAANNISKYWSDNSYLETVEAQATIVYYGSCWLWSNIRNRWENDCDHSAVRITSGTHAGKYESKWGQWGRYIHASNKCPFIDTNRRFFKFNTAGLPALTGGGGSEFCIGQTKSYSASNWKSCYTLSSSLNISNVNVSGSVCSFSVTATQNGEGWLVIKSGGLVILNTAVWIGPPPAPSFGYWRSGSPATYTFKANSNELSYYNPTGLVWELHTVPKGNSLFDTFTTGIPQGNYTFQPASYNQTYYIALKVMNACGTGITSTIFRTPNSNTGYSRASNRLVSIVN